MKHFERFIVKEDDFLIREGEKSDDLYILIQGCLKIEKKYGQRILDLGDYSSGTAGRRNVFSRQ